MLAAAVAPGAGLEPDPSPKARTPGPRSGRGGLSAPAGPGVSAPRASDLYGLGRLGVEGTLQVAALVEAMHAGIQQVATLRRPRPGARPDPIARLAYAGVRGVTGAVGLTLDLIARRFDWPVPPMPPVPRREALLAALNGVLGDHLSATGNPLAIPLGLWQDDQPLPLADATALRPALSGAGPRLLITLHGLCMNPWQWRATEPGDPAASSREADIESMARGLGYRVLALHYNSGRRIAENGIELAVALQRLLEALPQRPREMVLLGHSMGGLVARSALHVGLAQQHAWIALPLKLICLGSPHHGAPLERAGHGVETLLEALPLVAPFARLARLRSAGITDLRHGTLGDSGMPPPGLPSSVKLYAVAATRSSAAALARPRSDGLVPVASALGRHRDPRRELGIPADRQRVIAECGHLALLRHPKMLQTLQEWLEGSAH